MWNFDFPPYSNVKSRPFFRNDPLYKLNVRLFWRWLIIKKSHQISLMTELIISLKKVKMVFPFDTHFNILTLLNQGRGSVTPDKWMALTTCPEIELLLITFGDLLVVEYIWFPLLWRVEKTWNNLRQNPNGRQIQVFKACGRQLNITQTWLIQSCNFKLLGVLSKGGVWHPRPLGLLLVQKAQVLSLDKYLSI